MMGKEYLAIANEIIYRDDYQKLKHEKHHGISRYEHSIRVGKRTYIIAKRMGLDYKSATKAALLHDFFTSNDSNYHGVKILYNHPLIACKNASKIIELSNKETNIIKSHMFPLSKSFPKSKEAWIVSLVDKRIATYEFIKYKFNLIYILKEKRTIQ